MQPLSWGKIPPQAIELEESILGAALIEKGVFDTVSEILTAEMFYKDAHQMIFKAIRHLSDTSMPIDLFTVVERLKKEGELDMVGGAYYLTSLTNKVASTAHTEAHCLIVVQKYMQRELIRLGSDIIKNGFDDKKDVFQTIEQAEKEIFAIGNNSLKKDFRHISLGIADALKKVDELRSRKVVLTGVDTGFRELNDITNGWQNTDMIVLAARPSVGKSALALNFALNAAFSESKPTAVGIFSLEMSELQLVNRMMASNMKIPLSWIQTGNVTDGKVKQLTAGANQLSEKPIFLDDTAGLSIFELRAKARRMVSKHKVGLLIIDYLQLMSGDGNTRNREQEVSNISRQLKALAKELEIPVIALSQLSRDVEKRGSNVPKLSDLRESGAIEQDADMVAFIYRPSKEDIGKDAALATMGFIGIAKHRNGKLADLTFYVDLSIQRWFDLEKGLEYERSLETKRIAGPETTNDKDLKESTLFSELDEDPF